MLVEELAVALQPLHAALESPGSLRDFLEDLGWDFDAAPEAVASLRGPVEEVFALAGDPDGIDAADVARVVTSVRAVFQAVSRLGSSAELAADVRNELPRQLVDYLVVEYLLNNRPRIGYLLMALGIVSREQRPAAGSRPAYLFRGIGWDRLSQLLRDPLTLLEGTYRWGQSDFAAARLIESMAGALAAWGLKVRPELLDEPTASALNSGALQPDAATEAELRLVLLEHPTDPALLNAGAGLTLLPETTSAKPGFALLPFATTGLDEEIALSDELSLAVHGDLDLTGGAGILVRPGRDVEIVRGLASGAPSPASGALAIVLRLASAGTPFTPIGRPDASRFELTGLSTTAGTRLSNGKIDAFIELAIDHGKVVIDTTTVMTGLLVDEWVEFVPGTHETTALAFQFDAPDACAPQSVLIAVPPVPGQDWTSDTLRRVLMETLDLAKLRAVDTASLGAAAQHLPGLYLALNTEDHAVSTDFVPVTV